MFISVIGASTCDPETYALAEKVGRLLAESGATVVCGGMGGVMEAVCKGAQGSGGQTIGILPGSNAKEANSYVDVPIVTGLGEARNAIVVRSGQAVIAIGGGYGTLSEIGFALKFAVPVIALNTWELCKAGQSVDVLIQAKNAEQAVQAALEQAGALEEQ